MQLKIKYKVKDMTSCAVIDANKVVTTVKYKGEVIPSKVYKTLEKSILNIEDIINSY